MNSPMRRGDALTFMMVLALGVGGCAQEVAPPGEAVPTPNTESAANRGIFVEGSCSDSERVAVPANAAFALYFDQAGNELESALAEDLGGTQDKMMCQAEEGVQSDEPGLCGTKCPITMGRKTYCVPPPCP